MNTHHLEPQDILSFRAFELLRKKSQTVVTAESCTAGLIAATLSGVPGVSSVLAGGFVVYQIESKIAWLEISEESIRQHGVVSSEVAELMAVAALQKTAHATIAISITGHLGPDAPLDLDGVAWLGFAQQNQPVCSQKLHLQTTMPVMTRDDQTGSDRGVLVRHERQRNAVRQALEFLCKRLEAFDEP